jgi:hypothetical protein
LVVASMANWRRNAPLHAPEPRGQGHRSGARLGLDAVARPTHRFWWLLAEGRTIGEVLSGAVGHRHPRAALPLRSATAGMTRRPELALVPGLSQPTAGLGATKERSRDQGSRRALGLKPSAASTQPAPHDQPPAGNAAAAPAGPAAAHRAHPPAPGIAGSRGSPPLPGS